MNDVVQIKNIYKSYGEKAQLVQVLQGISLAIESGQRVLITGESGSGKTTLLSVISGLDNIDKGEIEISLVSITTMNEEARAKFRLKNIGFVFQHHYLLQDFTALGNVMLPLHMLGYKKDEAKESAVAILDKVGLRNRLDHLPSQMSGGECQRTAIARALVHNPLLVLADEPTGALDSNNSATVRNLLSSLVQEQQTTLVVASHDKDFLEIADRHLHINMGDIETISRTQDKA